VPSDVEALIERYLGSRRITAAQADVLLAQLATPGVLSASSAPAAVELHRGGRRYNTPFPQGLAGADELPEIHNGRALRTPLPGFHPPVARIADAARLSSIPPAAVVPTATATPAPVFTPSGTTPVTPLPAAAPYAAGATPVPMFSPEPASVPPAPPVEPFLPAATPVPARAPASLPPQPLAASQSAEHRDNEDSFEILVDDEVLELEPDDLLIEDADDDES